MKRIVLFLSFLAVVGGQAQALKDTIPAARATKDTLVTGQRPSEVVSEVEEANHGKPLVSPTKAGLYSTVLPGLGQLYNRKYWKIPIVWGAVGTGVGIIVWNQHQYTRYRRAFIASLNGQPNEFSDIPGITPEILGRTQDQAKRQRDYAIALTAAVYVLNIIDAVVDAHLAPMKNDPDLALAPTLITEPIGLKGSKPGLALVFKF